ncbi:MAG: hypothetical protein OEW15_05140, partial [Nitrospirota bacterium]|nr:hypothetical protein [Nitrospirota bacterium]
SRADVLGDRTGPQLKKPLFVLMAKHDPIPIAVLGPGEIPLQDLADNAMISSALLLTGSTSNL